MTLLCVFLYITYRFVLFAIDIQIFYNKASKKMFQFI